MSFKVSPLSTGTDGNPGQNILGNSSGKSASPERLASAKAIAAGEDQIKVTQADPSNLAEEYAKNQLNIRKIKMRTNASPTQYTAPSVSEESQIKEESASSVQANNQTEASSEIAGNASAELGTAENSGTKEKLHIDEQTKSAEATKPLSPQFAALARQRRALQVKERELADRERQLEQKASQGPAASELIDRLKSQPLSVLQEHGVTYDQLTEAILANQSGLNPEIQALKAEIKSLKEGIDKTFVDRDTQAEQQVLAEMRREADKLAYSGDTYELVRETKSVPDVINLIHRTYKETGEVLDVSEAMQLVEDELLEDRLKIVNTKKIQSKLKPAQAEQQAVQPTSAVQQPKQMKTLTNRDTASVPLSRKERAIAAMLGQLKK